MRKPHAVNFLRLGSAGIAGCHKNVIAG
jgi:hypothetical protein